MAQPSETASRRDQFIPETQSRSFFRSLLEHPRFGKNKEYFTAEQLADPENGLGPAISRFGDIHHLLDILLAEGLLASRNLEGQITFQVKGTKSSEEAV